MKRDAPAGETADERRKRLDSERQMKAQERRARGVIVVPVELHLKTVECWVDRGLLSADQSNDKEVLGRILRQDAEEKYHA